ncbi:hypothetical protein SAE02_74210 [Skermanella aerolata]|uniref:Uncharacterized protein n=1 Tax=Skermanella aerolata TaxID=393310 RepID=A0A512E3F5_9PROT|nr:hypothetical protein SAE02_74210 [Skermanella aerolata]
MAKHPHQMHRQPPNKESEAGSRKQEAGSRKSLAGEAFPPLPWEQREADRVFFGCGRQVASTRLQPVQHL